jgi:hypothetical protein
MAIPERCRLPTEIDDSFRAESPLRPAHYYVSAARGRRTPRARRCGTNYYFYVGTASDTTTPTVRIDLADKRSISVGINASIRVAFSEPIGRCH